MAQLVLLVVAAAWLAVLLPPMLRSRVENRPNSSVTDFRRQLTKLQNTATPPRGAVRAMGRPLASSPLQRPAAGGRPRHAPQRSGVSLQQPPAEPVGRTMAPAGPARRHDESSATPRYRSHGDPSGEMPRSEMPRHETSRSRSHGGATGRHPRPEMQRRPAVDPRQSSAGDVKRRRTNVLFTLLIITACTLFLAATTSSTVMLYLFALSFLGLCGYVYLLAQYRERTTSAYDGWFDGGY